MINFTKMRDLRLDKGISQAQVSKIICVSSNTYAAWENGKRPPSDINLRKLLKYFGDEIKENNI